VLFRSNHPLRPTDIYVELGKLCVYSQRADYCVPRRYYFVAPREIGPKLHDLLKKPDHLKSELIANWDQYCTKKISEKEELPLEADLKAYVEAFDFRIVWFRTLREVLKQHQRTRYWYQRFKVDPPQRPASVPVPDQVQPHELVYTTRLLEAYSDHLKQSVTSIAQLTGLENLSSHFRRSRGYFFSAEALARFSRDHFGPEAFDAIKKHIHDGVIDVTQEPHADGYECVVKVTNAAATLPLPHSDLMPYVGPADKKGICHHLANDEVVYWVKP
jgi:hypothetical protein